MKVVPRLYLLLLFFLHFLIPADLDEEDEVPVEVIVDSSSCSTTCGLGVKVQTLCFLKDSKTAMEEEKNRDGAEVPQKLKQKTLYMILIVRCKMGNKQSLLN